MGENCDQILSQKLYEELITLRNTKSAKFPGYKKPAIKAVLWWVVMTIVYIFAAVLILKSEWKKPGTTESDKESMILEVVGIYCAIILPVTLIIYAMGLNTLAHSHVTETIGNVSKTYYYRDYAPDAKYPKGMFWGISVFTILTLVFVCGIFIMERSKTKISAAMISIVSVLIIGVSVTVSSLAKVWVECKLEASTSYKKQFKCALKREAEEYKEYEIDLKSRKEKAQKELTKASVELQKLEKGKTKTGVVNVGDVGEGFLDFSRTQSSRGKSRHKDSKQRSNQNELSRNILEALNIIS